MDSPDPVGSRAHTPFATRRFDVIEFHRMAEVGILRDDDHVELIEGELAQMAPVGVAHMGAVMALTRLLVVRAGDLAQASVQNPLRLDRHNEPEPDVCLLRPRADEYRRGEPPSAADVLLVIEVSDTTIRYDRSVKVPLYARFGVPEVWIVDIASRAIGVYRDPSGDSYRSVEFIRDGATVQPLGLPGVNLLALEVFGPA